MRTNILVWCEVVVTGMEPEKAKCREVSERLYDELVKLGIHTILDDRDERPGVKFKDADRVGIPHRVTVGPRGIADGVVELKCPDGEFRCFPIAHAAQEIAKVVRAPEEQ